MGSNGQMHDVLLVNRVEILPKAGCSACGREFSTNPVGEKALVLSAGNPASVYFFCSSCGDNIMSHVESEDSRKRYGWDWAVPLRGAGFPAEAH